VISSVNGTAALYNTERSLFAIEGCHGEAFCYGFVNALKLRYYVIGDFSIVLFCLNLQYTANTCSNLALISGFCWQWK
jgi:hypothetical protein